MNHTDPNEQPKTEPQAPDVRAGDNGHGLLGNGDDYSADKIKVLEGLEAVRTRPAMYIGSTGPAGPHYLVYEGVDNSTHETPGGFCDPVHVTIHIDGPVALGRHGRRTPRRK